MIRQHCKNFTWQDVEVMPYKEDGNLFKNVTRQTLHKGDGDLSVELRYFEVGAGGHSTLERHHHSHIVTIIRGSGRVLVGDEVSEIGLYDVVHIPPMTWHQFQSARDQKLGFLCVVSTDRDRPQRPGPEELETLLRSEPVADFIRV